MGLKVWFFLNLASFEDAGTYSPLGSENTSYSFRSVGRAFPYGDCKPSPRLRDQKLTVVLPEVSPIKSKPATFICESRG
jgi:hypothetical protein